MGTIRLRRIGLSALALYFLFLAAPSRLRADSLVVGGGQCTGNVTVNSGSAQQLCTYSPPNSGALYTEEAEGNLAMGTFGAYVNIAGGDGGSGGSSASVAYNFSTTSVKSGTAEFNFNVNGIFSESNAYSDTSFAEFEDQSSGQAIINGVSVPSRTAQLPSGENSIELLIPIVNGQTTLDVILDSNVTVGCHPTTTNCSATTDFLDPLSITSASVLDSNGVLVPGATLISQSGYSPSAATVTATPEPSTLALLSTGLGLLGFAAALKRRSPNL